MSGKCARECIHGIILFILLFLIAKSYASSPTFQWREKPHIHEGYFYTHYLREVAGFEIYIEQSKRLMPWHIQVHTENSLDISNNPYVIKFKVSSNNSFILYSRLGERDYKAGNSYIDETCDVHGDESFHECKIDFQGYSGINVLYFQIGKAPSGTKIEIKDIQIVKLD